MSTEKPRRLGRGLDALIGGGSNSATTTAPAPASSSELQRIPLSRIRPNPFQPRREFDAEELADLEASLKASGLLQPITVRRRGDAYELVAGERRYRAATNLGWKEIQAVVRDYDDQTMLVLALVENLQRADLNAIDEARGYKRLLEEFSYTQQQVADAIGKDRTTIANLLRLLTLPAAIQEMVEKGQLTPGHARAILSAGDERAMLELAREVVARGLNVRDTEQRTRSTPTTTKQPSGAPNDTRPADPTLRAIEDDLRRHLQTDVKISLTGADQGSLRIGFYSAEDFDRLLDLILGSRRTKY